MTSHSFEINMRKKWLLMISQIVCSFPAATNDDAQSVPNSAVKSTHVRHSSESEVDTPPKVEGNFFETPPKGW